MRVPKPSDRYLEDIKELSPTKGTPITQIFPEIYEHWIHELNCGYEPDDFQKGSRWLAWWFCSKAPDHVYLQQITAHFKGLSRDSPFQGCTFCKGNFGSVTNSLATVYPDIAAEWNTLKNKDFNPNTVSHSSGRKAWWKCRKCKHSWKAVIANRTVNGHGCPKCNSKGFKDLRDFPAKLKQFDRKKNKGVDPHNLKFHEKYFWRCTKDPTHEWLGGIYLNDQEHCPKCFLLQNNATNNLSRRRDLAAQFHKTKNGKLKPENLSLGSRARVWWQCKVNKNHEWQAMVCSRARSKGSCPYCRKRKLSKENSLAVCFPLIAAQWHPTKNKTVIPEKVSASSSIRYWWKCPEGPDHEWQASVIMRTKQNTRCPFCVNKRLSVTNSLSNYPHLLKELDYKKNKSLKPEKILAASSLRLWWVCLTCKKEWQTTVRSRAILGGDCRSCKVREGKRRSREIRTRRKSSQTDIIS